MTTHVEAKFDFVGQDESQLSFHKGDIIQVVSQLDSGWWDGICKGERGWFPSNYVIQVSPNTINSNYSAMLEDAQMANNIRYAQNNANVGSSVASIDTQMANIAAAATGNTNYYINSTSGSGSINHPNSAPGSAVGGMVTANPNLATANATTNSKDSKLPPNWGFKSTPALDGVGGRIYYYNKVTDETCWNLDDINMETGELKNKHNMPTLLPSFTNENFDGLEATSEEEKKAESVTGQLTWPKLAHNIYDCLQQLITSSQQNRKELYINHSTAIVETIRTMLYASNTAKRDSPILQSDKPLKSHHKHIMSALSRLVVTTKTASQVWPPPDAVSNMQNAATDVWMSVRQFIFLARDKQLKLNNKLVDDSNSLMAKKSTPRDDSDQSSVHSRRNSTASNSTATNIHDDEDSQQQNSSQIIAQLYACSKTISESAQNLANTIRTCHANVSSEVVITETKKIVIDVGIFLAVIDEIDYDTVNNDVIVAFKLNRLAVCNSISGLVMATQTVVDSSRPSNFEEQILLSTELIEKAINDFVISTKCLLQEKENADQLQYQRMLNEYNRRPSSSSSTLTTSSSNMNEATNAIVDTVDNATVYSVNGQTYMTAPHSAGANENPPSISNNVYGVPRNRRAMSLSAVNGVDGNLNGGMVGMPGMMVGNGNTNMGQPMMNGEHGYYEFDDMNLAAAAAAAQQAQMRNRTFSQRSLPAKLTESLANVHISGAANAGSTNPKTGRKLSNPMMMNPPPPTVPIPIPMIGSNDDDDDDDGEMLEGNVNERKTSNAKLMKLLGKEAATNIVGMNEQITKKPKFLEYDYDQKDLVFNMEGKVKGGTLEALVERLTLHDSFDSNFTNTFLLTYRSFCTSTELINSLINRYMIPKPNDLATHKEIQQWYDKKQRPIRLRVCNVVKSWFETYSVETDEEDQKAFQVAKDFFEKQIEQDPFFTTVSKLLDKFDKGFEKKLLPTPNRDAPPPILPKSFRHIRFIELDPLEIARQLTLMGSKLYNQIQPVECLNKAWSKKENSPAVNIKKMIEMSNQITGWVANTILQENDLKRRCGNIKHFIYIAEKCYQLNNFNTLMSILAGLSSAPIHRLNRTWELLNNKALTIIEQLRKTMDRNKNFSQYREELHSVNPPCVPFLGVYLTDLTFIEDGNPDRLKSNSKLINFSKQSKTADVIREIQQYQNQPYCLQTVPEIQDYLLTSFQLTTDEVDMYQKSLILEPREREDEKITRLLFESGFL